SRDRPPFGTVVEPPDNRFNRAPILLAGPRATNLHRHNRRFELRPLGIRQDLHRLATPMPNKISRPVTSASHQLRTDPSFLHRLQTHKELRLLGVSAGSQQNPAVRQGRSDDRDPRTGIHARCFENWPLRYWRPRGHSHRPRRSREGEVADQAQLRQFLSGREARHVATRPTSRPYAATFNPGATVNAASVFARSSSSETSGVMSISRNPQSLRFTAISNTPRSLMTMSTTPSSVSGIHLA